MNPVRFRLNLRKVEADAERLLASLRRMKKGARALEAKAARARRVGAELRATVERLIREVPRG